MRRTGQSSFKADDTVMLEETRTKFTTRGLDLVQPASNLLSTHQGGSPPGVEPQITMQPQPRQTERLAR